MSAVAGALAVVCESEHDKIMAILVMEFWWGVCRARGKDGRMKRSRAGYITVRDDEARVLV